MTSTRNTLQQDILGRFIVPASGSELISHICICTFQFNFETRQDQEEREKEIMASTPTNRVQDKVGRKAYQQFAYRYSLVRAIAQAEFRRYIMSQVFGHGENAN